MVHMTNRGTALLALTLATAAGAAACVPEPANRATPPADVGATPTPVPTPAGPTPTPSFVRPTPTPAPTFLTYTVKTGDTLEKIAKRYHTTVRSISYWNRATYPSLDPESSKYRPNAIKVGWTLLLIPNKETDPENLPPASGQPSEEPSIAPTPAF
jgi:nucleoid-associated protein YgaU